MKPLTLAVPALLFAFLQACGGSHADSVAAGGAGSGVGGSPGGLAGGSSQSAGTSNGSAGGTSLGPQKSADKLDVLFVIDNSVSMLGKQKILAKSVPAFVSRLTNPWCLDDRGKPVAGQPTQPGMTCTSGKREFEPIADIHFGVITTSLGSHGGDICTGVGDLHQQDDQAQLLPSKRSGVSSYKDSGFLAYDALGNSGDSDAAGVAKSLGEMIAASGEQGCGYEAPLEAMYRFLVDPEPPTSVEVTADKSAPVGINETLLAQRSAFLRPDSALAIVLFSDENDCSIMDSGLGWLVASSRRAGAGSVRMPRATSSCETDPNDACCRSCAAMESSPPAGCAPLAEDSVCSVISSDQPYAAYDMIQDSLNLRCFDQQRRFGLDVLHPVERYADALSNPKIKNRAGTLVDNPLFAARAGQGPRSATLISVSVIVGAPWQDLATPESSSGGPLEYLDGEGLERDQRWPMLIGDKRRNVPPSDPFMIESIAPRSGQNPITMLPIAAATSTNPLQSPINGHEKNNFDQWDLQHACIFPLPEPVSCTPDSVSCDCSPDNNGDTSSLVMENNALCQPPSGGPSGTTQYFGKAYPGTRELTFAQQMGARAVAASMCPRSVAEATSPDYGYEPAFAALLGRIAKTVK